MQASEKVQLGIPQKQEKMNGKEIWGGGEGGVRVEKAKLVQTTKLSSE